MEEETSANVRGKFEVLLEAPGRNTYLAVREALVRTKQYQPDDRSSANTYVAWRGPIG
jgi:hypothetical protein